MKKTLLFLLILISSRIFFIEKAFSASLKEAEERLLAIKNFKEETLDERQGEPFSDEEIKALNILYEILESEEYTASSLNGELGFSVGKYNVREMEWTAEIKGNFFDGGFNYERSVDILYSTAMEKKHVAEEDMSEHQRRNYENFVIDYEDRLQSGETVFFAELSFKLTHWQGSNEYRIEPGELKIYKKARKSREIISIDEKESISFFTFGEEREYRSKEQIKKDTSRVKRLLHSEAKKKKNEKKQREKKAVQQKGRRAFFISAETSQDNINFSDTSIFSIVDIYGTLTWGFGRFIFAGLSIGVDIEDTENDDSAYSFGGLLGANLNLGRYFRPFIAGEFLARTDDRVILKGGIGTDFMIGHFMLTAGYNLNWDKNLDSSNGETHVYNSYYVGLGFTW